MIVFKDDCVDCPAGMGCLGNTCPYKNVPHFYCDECNNEVGECELYIFEGEQLCLSCIEERLPKVDATMEVNYEPDESDY